MPKKEGSRLSHALSEARAGFADRAVEGGIPKESAKPYFPPQISCGVSKVRRFTKKELAQYNGQGGTRTYVAYKGRVYDVSQSFLWQHGKHQVLHSAGKDLSGSLAEAPHGPELLEKFPVVGILEDS